MLPLLLVLLLSLAEGSAGTAESCSACCWWCCCHESVEGGAIDGDWKEEYGEGTLVPEFTLLSWKLCKSGLLKASE